MFAPYWKTSPWPSPTSLSPRVSRNIFSVLGTRVIGAAQAEVATPNPNEARIVMTVRTGVA
jgi:hypothetical protein